MRLILTAAYLSFVLHSVATAQPSPIRTFVVVDGSCDVVTVQGNPARCPLAPRHDYSGLFYEVFSNGEAAVTVGLATGGVFSFVGSKDSQPDSNDYYLYLSHIRLAEKGGNFVANVGGQCIVNLSTDGTQWHSVNCTAIGADGMPYALHFHGSGEPANVKHF